MQPHSFNAVVDVQHGAANVSLVAAKLAWDYAPEVLTACESTAYTDAQIGDWVPDWLPGGVVVPAPLRVAVSGRDVYTPDVRKEAAARAPGRTRIEDDYWACLDLGYDLTREMETGQSTLLHECRRTKFGLAAVARDMLNMGIGPRTLGSVYAVFRPVAVVPPMIADRTSDGIALMTDVAKYRGSFVQDPTAVYPLDLGLCERRARRNSATHAVIDRLDCVPGCEGDVGCADFARLSRAAWIFIWKAEEALGLPVVAVTFGTGITDVLFRET